MRILRLSLFNLRKNKKEAAAVSFLTMVTVLMLSVFAANNKKISKIFDESFANSGSVREIVLFNRDSYHDEFKRILEREYKVSRLSENKFIFAGVTDVRERSGDLISYNFLFETERTERKIENFVKTATLPDEEIRALTHPIWLPNSFYITKGYEPGDTFTIVKGGKDYPFTIAGFYETGLAASDGYGYKVVLSDEDYELFSMLFNTVSTSYSCIGLCFDCDDFDYEEYIDMCEHSSYENLLSIGSHLSYEEERNNETNFTDMFLMLIVILSVITMISALFMIRHKISNDIEDQIQQIGVLEALGYKAGEISLSYLYEYVISAGSGCLLGIIISCLITPVINKFTESMLGRAVHGHTEVLTIVLVALAILMAVILFALLKTRTVKKYPPVTAFRRGIGTHHFGKNRLPLEKSVGNINLRLAMKGFLSDIKSNIGVTVCIITAGMTILFSMVSFDFFKDGTKGLESMMGIDTQVIMVQVLSGVDPENILNEIAAMPEVRKSFVTYELDEANVRGSEMPGTTQVYPDFYETENIFPASGRFPEHDNEIMISYRRSELENLKLGDSIVLEKNGLERSYVITGIVSSMMNSGSSLYLTSEGYRKINLNARPNMIHIYLKDGVSEDDFQEKLVSRFGMSAKDAVGDSEREGSLEERIRAAAEEKIAVMMSQYGVTSIDYAIQVGDELITGNSRRFVIKEVSSWRGIIKSQIAPISDTFRSFTILAAILIAIIVAVILSIISASAVRRQRMSLGIMKGLGYSSKDLMTQMALKMMPVVIVSLIAASFGAVWFDRLFWFNVIGLIARTNITVIIITDIFLAVFCYVVTYISAGRIKKISVNELMTE